MSTFRNLLMARSRRRNAPAVKGLVGAWKGYGRSNSEDASTRNILYDYSGNGYNITLENFAFSGMSGWGGEYDDFLSFISPISLDETYFSKEDKKLTINTLEPPYTAYNTTVQYFTGKDKFKAKVRLSGLDANKSYVNYVLFQNQDSSLRYELNKDGDYEIDYSNFYYSVVVSLDYNSANFNSGMDPIPLSQPITLEIIPWYNGALVSDGVDDHGWCSGFPLKDDFTVVAIRKILPSSRQGYLCVGFGRDPITDTSFKVMGVEGQFNTSFGGNNYFASTDCPPLFLWMTKTSYNGIPISTGLYESTDRIRSFYLFTDTGSYKGVYALYDLRIYDHSLTEDELQTVRDEMMAEYEANVNPLGSVHYIADWDAKGRSNDEDADARKYWADKVSGKKISLSNYDFGGKSGWGEYPYNFSDFQCMDQTAAYNTVSSTRLTANAVTNGITFRLPVSHIPDGVFKARLKITGLDANPDATITIIRLYCDTSQEGMIDINEDGIYDIEYHMPEGASYFWVFCFGGSPAPVELATPIYIDMLPTIAGVLASDGVDDYGMISSSKDHLNLSEVNTMLCFARIPRTGVRYEFAVFTTLNYPSATRLWAAIDFDGLPDVGSPNKTGSAMTNMYALTRDVEYDENKTSLDFASNHSGTTKLYSVCTIQRIVLIRENIKEDIDFLKWKVEKEYRDWCKENGYDPTPMLTIPEAI